MDTEQRADHKARPDGAKMVRAAPTAHQRVRLAMLRAIGLGLRVIRPRPRAPLTSPCTILAIRPDHLGDLLFLTPALRWLRANLPEARINLMLGPWGEELMEGCPYVDEIMTCSFPGFTRQPATSPWAPYRQLWSEARKLHAWHFDLALVMRFDHWWGAMLTAAARIPRRLGYDIPEVRPFINQAVPYVAGQHEVMQNLRLMSGVRSYLPEMGAMDKDRGAHPLEHLLLPSEVAWAQSWLQSQGVVPDRPLVAIHPGAGAAVKLWRVDRWAEVIDGLTERRDAQVVLTGGSGELDLVWAIAARTQSTPLMAAGETTLGQLAALFGSCKLVLGADSGPLHLAVAVGTPTLHLYGPVDAQTFGPWGEALRHRVVTSGWPCIPCNRLDFAEAELSAHPCMQDISVDQVLAGAESLLAGTW